MPDRGPGTGTNYEKRVNGSRNSVRKFQPGKRAHLFRFSTFSGNFPVGRTLTDEPEIPEILTKRKARRIPGTGFRILCQWNLDSGFQSLVGFRIP